MNMKKGFTLIELLMVVAIIAIISTLAVNKVGGIREASARKVSVANQLAVERSIESYLVNGGALNRLDSLMYAQEGSGAPVFGSTAGDFDFTLTKTGEQGYYRGPSADDPTGTYREKNNAGLTPGLLNVFCYYTLSEAQANALITRLGLRYVVAATGYATGYPSVHYSKDRAFGDGTVPNASDGLDPNASFCVATAVTNKMLVAAINPMTDLGRTIYQACGQEIMNTKNWGESYTETEVRAEVKANGGPLIAFGLGDSASVIGKSNAGLESAPYCTFAQKKYYSRYILLIRLRTVGSGSVSVILPELAGVLDCCGNTVRAAQHIIKSL